MSALKNRSSIIPMPFGARLTQVAVAISLVSVACTSSGLDATTTSISSAPLTTLTVPSSAGSTSDAPSTTSPAPKVTLTAPEYKIVDRIEGEDGDTVVVLLDPDTYDSLTDLDLYDLIAEVVELFPPIAAVHVVDDAIAVDIVVSPDASDADRKSVATHYLARLDDGVKIIYLGPFAAAGTAVLGS